MINDGIPALFSRMDLPCWCLLLLSCLPSLSAHNDFFTSIGNTGLLFDQSVTASFALTSLESFRHGPWVEPAIAILSLTIVWSPLSVLLFPTGQMTDLLYTEKDLVTSLKDYIKAEENKLERLKQWVTHLHFIL